LTFRDQDQQGPKTGGSPEQREAERHQVRIGQRRIQRRALTRLGTRSGATRLRFYGRPARGAAPRRSAIYWGGG
jgi:hypothetical protein